MYAAALALLVASFGATELAPTGELQTRWLPEHPTIVVHLNVAELRDTSLGQLLLEDKYHLGVTHARGEMMAEIGIDPATEIHGITAYVTGSDLEAGTLLVQMTDKIDTLIAHLQDNDADLDEYHTVTKHGHTIHSWCDDPEDEDAERVYACVIPIADERLVILANGLDRVVDGLEVYAGLEPDFTDAEAPSLMLDPDAHAIVYAECGSLAALPDIEPASKILQHSRSLRLELREIGRHVCVNLSVETGSEQKARDIRDVLTGTVALGRIIASDDPDLAFLHDLSRTLSIEARRTRIVASLKCELQMIESTLRAMADDHRSLDHDQHDDRDDDDADQ